jgi:hypothetical protein
MNQGFHRVVFSRTWIYYVLILGVILGAYIAGPLVAANHESIRLIGWDLMLLWVIGVLAVFVQTQAGFPELADVRVNNARRFGWPVLIGMIFGLADVVVFELILKHPPYQKLPPFLQPFPYSLLLYSSGAVYVEILHRLLPLTLIMFLARKFLPEKYQAVAFWIAAMLSSLWEPLEQLPQGAVWLVIYSFLSGFAFNLIQAVAYRRSGWLASLFVRLGHYVIWHIMLGLFVQYFVLK